MFPPDSDTRQIMLASGEPALALLPTRFRKLIWVKRGDYLITSTSAGDFETSAGEAGKVGDGQPPPFFSYRPFLGNGSSFFVSGSPAVFGSPFKAFP